MAKKRKVAEQTEDYSVLESMLNYFEISKSDGRDETLSESDRNRLLEDIVTKYDSQVLQDVISKLISKRGNPSDSDGISGEISREDYENLIRGLPSDEEFPDDMGLDGIDDEASMDELDDEDDDKSKFELPKIPPSVFGKGKLGPENFNPEIEKFLMWLQNILYSHDQRIVVVNGNGGIQITITRIDNGKKK